MPGPYDYDFFVSRRSTIAETAKLVLEVLDDLTKKSFSQDFDIPHGANFVAEIHDGLSKARDLIALITEDYFTSHWCRQEWSNFLRQHEDDPERRILPFRCDDCTPDGLFAGTNYIDLHEIDDREERKRRIRAALEGKTPSYTPPPARIAGSPPPRLKLFAGRDDELARLDAILTGGGKPVAITQARAAVSGQGGVGKTSLAAEYMYRFRDFYAGVCWCDARGDDGPMLGLAALARDVFGVRREQGTPPDEYARAALSRLSESRTPWLLIYDNVDRPAAIRDWYPRDGARLLITSRFQDWRSHAADVSVDVLPPDQAAALLCAASGLDDSVGALALAKVLGFLPLALDHAAAWCRTMHRGFADYAAAMEDRVRDVPEDADYPRSVAATIEVATDTAVERCAGAGFMMAILAQTAPERVPRDLLRATMDNVEAADAALAALSAVGLLKDDPFPDGTGAVTLHRLTRLIGGARAAQDGQTASAVAALVQALAARFPLDPGNNPASWPESAQLTPHLQALRDAGAASSADATHWAFALEQAAHWLRSQGRFAEAEPLFRAALASREQTLAPDSWDVAASRNSLAGFLLETGRFAEAEPLLGPCWPAGSRHSAATIPMSRHRATISPTCCATPGASRRPNPCIAPRWPAGSRRSAPTIPMSRHRATTSPTCWATPGASRRPNPCIAPRWPAGSRRSAPTIPKSRNRATTSPPCCTTPGASRRPSPCFAPRWPAWSRRSAPTIPMSRHRATPSPPCCTAPGASRRRNPCIAPRWPARSRRSPPTTPLSRHRA